MKRIVTCATFAVFALAPALAAADCGADHDKASMASSQPAAKAQVAQTNAGKSTQSVAKVSGNKQAVVKKSTQPSKKQDSTVVAKNN
jgi:hypothetical protein